jgi:hypothetical protein
MACWSWSASGVEGRAQCTEDEAKEQLDHEQDSALMVHGSNKSSIFQKPHAEGCATLVREFPVDDRTVALQ